MAYTAEHADLATARITEKWLRHHPESEADSQPKS